MGKRTVLGFPRTIYELGEQTKGFLNPWSSLKPSFLRRKIAPDILGVFRRSKKGLRFDPFFKVKDGFVDPKQLIDRWALVFPKRTYLPVDYPHFQLWLLSRDYVPSPKFLTDGELKTLGEIMKVFLDLYQNYSRETGKKGKVAFGFNSTPFSFIKDEQGRYYSGGQSVRVFHLHFLLVPPAKKISVKEDELSLIYPTDFSRLLLRLLFTDKDIQKKIGLPRSVEVGEGKRGMEIAWPLGGRVSFQKLAELLKEMDKLLYAVQLILVRSFYRDAEKLLERVASLEKFREISQAEKQLRHLLVVGKERPLEDTKSILIGQLEKLSRRYGADLEEKALASLVDKLVLDDNGDLASFVFGSRVVLRPGMGYGVLIEKKDDGGLIIKINPLDVLGSKGLIESSGYWFEKKIIKTEHPAWATNVLNNLIEQVEK